MISHGTEVHGDVHFHGSMHVEGRIIGDVVSDDGILRLAAASSVEGNIRAPNVVINGKVKGDVYSTERLELSAKAEVVGDIHYNLIEMVMGARIDGSLERMPEPAETGISGVLLKSTDMQDVVGEERIEKQVIRVGVEES